MSVKGSWQRPDDGNYGKGFDGIDWSAKGERPKCPECEDSRLVQDDDRDNGLTIVPCPQCGDEQED